MIDLQQNTALIPIGLDHVGVKAVQHPIQIQLGNTNSHTVATFDMGVNLPANKRGTHLSRFLEILHDQQWVLSELGLQEMLQVTAQRLDATHAQIDARFPIFLEKKAPASGKKSLMDYQAQLTGRLSPGHCDVYWTVQVPVTSLCPCSKEISKYGAHNQRSIVTISARGKQPIPVQQLITIAEESSSCEVYGILKRSDEKFITEKAYENPKFVEDIVREVADRLQQDSNLVWFKVDSEHLESIHNHSAHAYIEWQRP